MDRRVIRSVYFDREKFDILERLSVQTRVPKAVYLREGIDLMMKKYENSLKQLPTNLEGVCVE